MSKNDFHDARMHVRLNRAGELTAMQVPHERAGTGCDFCRVKTGAG
jgi:hypothetical protein